MLSLFLGGLWLWNAVAYHAWLLTHINPAAWLTVGQRLPCRRLL
jgi:hypothetical protein